MKINSLLVISVFGCAALTLRAAAAADAPAASSAAKPAAMAAAGPYHLIKEIHIGGSPRTDYLTVDAVGRRLYVSHTDSIAVIDLDKDEVVGTVTGNLSGIHGVAIAHDLGLGFISNGAGNNVSIFDLKTLKVTKTVETGRNPDWIMFEPGQKEVYAFNGGSNSATVIDPVSGEVKATIALPGKPESATFDVAAGRVYDNIEDKAEVVAIDTKTHAIVATWPNAPAAGASGQAIDLAHHRLFLGCDDTMAMMDSTNGKLLSTLKASAGIDSAAFDPGTGYAFVPAKSGTTTIAKVDGDKLVLVQSLATATGAKTMSLDPTTHKFYTATVKYSAAPAAAAASGSARGRAPAPAAVADSFEVMVFGMDDKK